MISVRLRFCISIQLRALILCTLAIVGLPSVLASDSASGLIRLNKWTNENPATGPPATINAVMAYDSVNKVMLLHDSTIGATVQSQTWSYDVTTNTWGNITSPVKPPGRYGASMVYDTYHGLMILYGGYDVTSPYSPRDDTWVYNYTSRTWIDMNPAFRPSPRGYHAMVFDSSRGLAILFGGSPGNGTELNDTWAYDYASNNWTIISPVNKPPARHLHKMDYDTADDLIVLYGGTMSWNYADQLDDTWSFSFTGNSWTEQNPVTKPPARDSHAMVYDQRNGLFLLFGGKSYTAGAYNDTWTYNSTCNEWKSMNPDAGPSKRMYHMMTYDGANGFVVLFGGGYATTELFQYDDTWVYRYAATPPSAPRNLVATSNQEDISLHWQQPLDDGGLSLTNYNVYRGTSASDENLVATIGNVTTYADTAVTAGQTYSYRVTAVNGVGESAYSDRANATTQTKQDHLILYIVGVAMGAIIVIAVLLALRKRIKRAF